MNSLAKLKTLFAGIVGLHKRSPTFLLAAWFFLLLFAGTLLLAIPPAHKAGGPAVSVLTALFTAVSAFCVTGLTLVDTHDAFSPFGHVVIMLLIELGGVGIMTFAALGFAMIRRRLSLVSQAALTDALFQNNASLELKAIFRSMMRAIVLVQLAGMAILYASLDSGRPEDGVLFNLWSAAFHSVSAFCNAGFSIYPNNLVPLAGNRGFLFGISFLVILGGLGHSVLAELYRLPRFIRGREKRSHWLSFNTRIALGMTATLLLGGGALVATTNYFQAPADAGGVVDSIFHSIMARTAGFNSAPLDKLPVASCLFVCILMFIGGAPGSCAGGVKVTSMAIWIARLRANLRHDTSVEMAGYSIPTPLVSKARIVMALSTLWVTNGVIILSLLQPGIPLEALLFEQVSAFATVGLSMGVTPHLTDLSQIWIILSMIMGKFGPLTIALWMVSPTVAKITRPEGKLMIG